MLAPTGPLLPPGVRGSVRSFFGSTPKGCWDLSLDARDLSGNGNHLTVVGGPTRALGPFNGTCYSFWGESGDANLKVLRLVTPPDSISVRNLTACSVSMWVWPWTAPTVNSSLYAEFTEVRGTGRFSVFQLSTGALQAFVRPASGTAYILSYTDFTTKHQGEWTHIFFTHETTATGGVRRLFVNGEQVAIESTANVGAFSSNVSDRITIGGHDIGSSGSNSANARIGEVAVFHQKVPDRVVRSYYNWCVNPPASDIRRTLFPARTITPPDTYTRSLRRFGTRATVQLGSMTQFFKAGLQNNWVAHPNPATTEMIDLQTGNVTTATNAPARNGRQQVSFPGSPGFFSFNNTYGTGANFFTVPTAGSTLRNMRGGTILLWHSYAGAPPSGNAALYQESADAGHSSETRFGLWLNTTTGLLLTAFRAVSGSTAVFFMEPGDGWRNTFIRGWALCAATFDVDTKMLIMYKNGVRIASSYDATFIAQIEDVDPGVMTIGGWKNTGNTAMNSATAGGTVEVGVFNRALTPQEIYEYHRWVTSHKEDRVDFMRYTFNRKIARRGVVLPRRGRAEFAMKGDVRGFTIG